MRNRWQDWCIVAAGFWLIVSPHQLEFALDHYASGNACGVGALLVAYNLMIAGRQVDEGQEFVNLILGIWLIFSPYALGFSWLVSASVDMIAIGAAIVVLSTLGMVRSAASERRKQKS
ncbi:MAG TPA: SPW repeat protein [Burkholderiaceae bacterium]